MKFMASRINYPLLFMLIKIKVKKRCFSHTKSRAFSRALHFDTKGHLMTYFSPKISLPNTRANNLFSKKENNQGVARFQK
jgi:hypothetical protein